MNDRLGERGACRLTARRSKSLSIERNSNTVAPWPRASSGAALTEPPEPLDVIAHREVHGFLLGVHPGDPHDFGQRFVIEVDLCHRRELATRKRRLWPIMRRHARNDMIESGS